jgi:beta-glucosidase
MKEVAYKGITAGLDIEMASTAYINHLDELIEEGSVSEALLDEAVLRILKLKQDLGLFENPYKGADEHKEETLVLSEEHLEASLEVAHESIVLLQNNNQTMPLSKSMKIALIGPYAQSRKTIGPWSWHGRRDLHKTLEEALSSQVVFCKSAEQPDDLTKEDLDQIKKSDVVVLAMGEDEHLSGEAHSLSDIHLPQQQNDLFDLVRFIHTNVVVVLHNGRPLILTSLLKADAILECFFLGSRSADAIRDILFGDVNPSGKLPISYPNLLVKYRLLQSFINGAPLLRATRS